jgi:type II secretory ATPase GspE/PulE/Tfp pilus assembly ATPase PilB-like protein
MDMGMDPFNFADALLGILAQRLAKRLCDCKEAYVPDADELRLFVAEYAEELRHSKPAWKADYDGESAKAVDELEQDLRRRRAAQASTGPWAATSATRPGYKGRVGLHELLIADDDGQKADPGARPGGRDCSPPQWKAACAPSRWTAWKRS